MTASDGIVTRKRWPAPPSSVWGWASAWTTIRANSGGQQQRVAIARALVTSPTLLLADEPTGNLDSRTTLDVMALFQQLNNQGITILLVTHEPEVSHYAKRIIEMRDGRIRKDHPVEDRGDAAIDLMALDAEEVGT